MKQSILLLGFVLLLISGCQGGASDKSGVDVFIEGDGKFPEFLVGTWKSDAQTLEIVFEPDGTISSATMPLGLDKLKPGETAEFDNGEGGSKGYFKAGRRWSVYYKPARRELSVELSLERYRVEMPGGGIIEGSSRDILSGRVSEDGKTWQAEWLTFPEYYITTDEYTNSQLPVDVNDNPVATLTFQKVVSPRGE